MNNPFFDSKQATGGPPIRRTHRMMIGLGLTALVAAGAAAHRQGTDRESVAPVAGAVAETAGTARDEPAAWSRRQPAVAAMASSPMAHRSTRDLGTSTSMSTGVGGGPRNGCPSREPHR